jgi:CID domain
LKHYEIGTAKMAVLEWRNALFNARTDQMLPLLYVANEVLQNSRRNRGGKYLEAFGPVMMQSIEYMAEQLRSSSPENGGGGQLVEKIRYTVKIWGNRQVFSMRFINDVLHKLEKHRDGEIVHARDVAKLPADPQLSPLHVPKGGGGGGGSDDEGHDDDDEEKASFSPNHQEAVDKSRKRQKQTDSDDDFMQIMNGNNSDGGQQQQDNDEDDDDDDDADGDDLFADFSKDKDDNNGQPKLEIDVSVGAMDSSTTITTKDKNEASTKNQAHSPSKRPRRGSSSPRSSILSTTNMVTLWGKLTANQQDADLIIKTLKDMRQKAQDDRHRVDVTTLVGDKLVQAAKLNQMDKLTVLKYRGKLFQLANDRHNMEQQAVRYYHWLAQTIASDSGDLDLADTVETKLQLWAPVAEQLRTARSVRRQQERELQLAAELQSQRQHEQAEAAAFRAAALAKETEAKPGMVWNPTTREYQALNTDESWRD